MPSDEVISSFVQQAQTFQGTPIHRLLHQQRLARMAKQHQQCLSFEDLISASGLSTASAATGHSHRAFVQTSSPAVPQLRTPPREVVASFVQQAQTFEGTRVQGLLHQERLARRMANDHQQRFAPEDLMRASRLSLGTRI